MQCRLPFFLYSLVDIRLKKLVIIAEKLEVHTRTTVQLDAEQPSAMHLKGKRVSPNAPFKRAGIYWGYNVRLAESFSAVFEESPYKLGYDFFIAASDKGQSIDSLQLSKFKHLLIVFGGSRGIESCMDGDERIKTKDPSDIFDYVLSTSPGQGSGILRAEEAIWTTMALLRPKILQNQTQAES